MRNVEWQRTGDKQYQETRMESGHGLGGWVDWTKGLANTKEQVNETTWHGKLKEKGMRRKGKEQRIKKEPRSQKASATAKSSKWCCVVVIVMIVAVY